MPNFCSRFIELRSLWFAFAWTSSLAFIAGGDTALAQFDPDQSPIVEAPSDRWAGSELEPLAIYGDNSDFDVDNGSVFSQSFYHDLDIAGGFLFAAAGRNLEIYNLSSLPSRPNRPRSRSTARTTLPFWGSTDNGGSFFVTHVRAATEDLVAISVKGQGFSIWDTRNKSAPKIYYQDQGVTARQIHVLQNDSTFWAFVAHSGSGGGLIRYNLSAATSLSACLDDSPTSTNCGSVYQGEVGTFTGITALAGDGSFVAIIPPGVAASSVTLYDMSSPLDPKVKLSGTIGTFPDIVTDVAVWQSGGKLYLAAQLPSTTKIYDVTCATTPGACTLPSPVRTLSTPDPTGGNETTVSASTTGSRDFLYIGNSRRSGCAAQREYLFDVTSPSTAFDISPRVSTDGYWGWFYMDCATGFNNIKPWRGYFHGNVFYRAAHSGLDAHSLISSPSSDVFADGFESGDLSVWHATAGDP